MCDEQKSAYRANWITIVDNKGTIAGVNSEPLYLTKHQAIPLLALGAIIRYEQSNN